MSFFGELKRRNVFKVGIAYLVGSWLLIQISDIVFETIGTPPWVMQTLLAVLAIGFFIAMFFAWAFELTPEGIKREIEIDRTESISPQSGKKLNNIITILMALAIGYLLYDRFSGKGSEPFSQDTAAQITENGQEKRALTPVDVKPAINPKSIAVLPFTNRSNLKEDEFFVAGIHDDLLTNLARIGSLKVISRTSMLRFKDTKKPIPEIAAELGVATVMEGSVQRSGSKIRINVQLIDAQTDEHLWAQIYDRELTADNLFDIQSEISGKIARALKAKLSPEEQQRISDRPTENLAAYHAYLRGRQLMALRTSTDLEQARLEFERAVELDADFALAWVGIAETAGLLAGYSTMGLPESVQIQEESIKRALQLNDQLGEAYLSLAGVHNYYGRRTDAETAYKKAIELSPGYATAYQWYSNFVAGYPHRLQEAVELISKAAELDPLSSIIQLNYIDKLASAGRFGESEIQLNKLLELDPGFAPAYSAMAFLMGATGRFDEQIKWLRKSTELDPGRINSYSAQAITLLDMGNEEALADIKRTMEDIDDQHWTVGWIDTLSSLYRRNYPAALESGNWVSQQLGPIPDFQNFLGFVNILSGDYEKARIAFEIAEPRFFDRANWRAAIEYNNAQGCINAWVMMHTNDLKMGQDLLEMTLSYMENELPGYVEHADRYAYPACYAIKGDFAKALDAIEIQVEHGHISYWWISLNQPYFDPLRGEPRFEAALQRIHQRNALQRANLERLDAEAGP